MKKAIVSIAIRGVTIKKIRGGRAVMRSLEEFNIFCRLSRTGVYETKHRGPSDVGSRSNCRLGILFKLRRQSC